MDLSLRYGRERFRQAKEVLEGRDLKALRGYPNTVNNRLRAALLAVYACVRNHFASADDYATFADLLFELRLRRADGRLLPAIESMTSGECGGFGRRLYELAERVCARSLPTDRLRPMTRDVASTVSRRTAPSA